MQLDPGAVTQIARTYHGYYPVLCSAEQRARGIKSPPSSLLRYDNDFQTEGGSSLEIDCFQCVINIRLKTPYRGRTELLKNVDGYHVLHKVFHDPRQFFLPEIQKPKRRNSREASTEDEDPGPSVFRLTPFKSLSSVRVPPLSSSLALDSCHTPFKSLSSINGSSHPLAAVKTDNSSKSHEHEKSAKHQIDPPYIHSPLEDQPSGDSPIDGPSHTDSPLEPPDTDSPLEPPDTDSPLEPPDTDSPLEPPDTDAPLEPPCTDSPAEETLRILGPARPSPDLLPSDSSDTIYKTKTPTELAFLKRKFEMEEYKLKKKAVLSHKEKIQGFNTYLEHLPEFNEQRKINWSKH